MTNYKIGDFFNTRVVGEPGAHKLVIYQVEGCQTLDFGGAATLPRQTEVLTAIKVLGIDIEQIYGLQYGGRNKYTLYTKSMRILLKQEELTINGHIVKIYNTEPIIRDIGTKNHGCLNIGTTARD
ncbi:hypothetical protein ACJMK2_012145 [Sinanodonta woodiana]|uniref:DUF5675 domain-containing protein n=1 Tax=Sinanodonta woodiana TaxID=1069815 RepID=A0ABD3V787_SINWO